MTASIVQLLALAAASANGTPDLGELLRRLADREARVSALLKNSAVTATTRAEQDDSAGKPISMVESVVRSHRNNGNTQRELIRYIEDGKDRTDEEREKRKNESASDEKRRNSFRVDSSPFAANEQPKYRFTLLGTDGDANRIRIRFEPKEPGADKVFIGEGVVDVAGGALLGMRLRPAHLPMFVHRLDVQVKFDAPTPAGATLSEIRIDGEGSLIGALFRRQFRMTTTFSDYAFEDASPH